jgi:hypothetical protein
MTYVNLGISHRIALPEILEKLAVSSAQRTRRAPRWTPVFHSPGDRVDREPQRNAC